MLDISNIYCITYACYVTNFLYADDRVWLVIIVPHIFLYKFSHIQMVYIAL